MKWIGLDKVTSKEIVMAIFGYITANNKKIN